MYLTLSCTLCSGQVQINSPKIVDGISKPYLVLETKNMNATVTMETWLFTASAKLGAMELLDYWNKGNMNNQLQSQYQYYPWSHKLVLSANKQVFKVTFSVSVDCGSEKPNSRMHVFAVVVGLFVVSFVLK